MCEGPSGDRSYHHGTLRNAALAAGLKHLAEQSEEAFSLRGVARAVGVSASAVYQRQGVSGAEMDRIDGWLDGMFTTKRSLTRSENRD